MSVFPPWRVAQRRGRFLAASIGSLVRSRLHQEHLVTLTARFVAARIEIVSSAPREKARLTAIRDVFLRGTFERRTSSRREPFRFSERAVSQRTSIPWALPPWSDETPPFTRTSATPSLATTMRSLPRASPCLRVFCGVPYGRPEKTALLWTTTFLPNSATRTDTRARPYGLLCSSPARDALSRLRSWSLPLAREAMWRAVSICVTASMSPHEPIFPARCFMGLRWSAMAR